MSASLQDKVIRLTLSVFLILLNIVLQIFDLLIINNQEYQRSSRLHSQASFARAGKGNSTHWKEMETRRLFG